MIEVDLHRVFFIRGQLDNVDITSLKKDCIEAFNNKNKLSQDITDSKNEDLGIPKSKAIDNIVNTNIKSEGLIKGVIQVPADGNPIIMLSDHGTNGGFW